MAKKEKEVFGFMTFALFAGAGNIIFPPFIVAAGGDLWKTASGFFLLPIGPQFR